ncbi:MAG TPA: hypothetical protein VIG99_11780 [Myxococcaceae bacterium]|jgi:hypothetical protein
MRWRYWKQRLEQNTHRPIPETEAPEGLTEPQRALVLRSLREFQLGEAGEGRVAHEIDHVSWPGVDADFRALIKLWVREEGRHARILGHMVKGMGGTLLTRHWSTGGFTALRRLLGVRFKLLVALGAEVAGTVFYGLLARALPRGPLAAALGELEQDEWAHLQFQSEIFGMFGRWSPAYALIQAGWFACALGVSVLVWSQHAATLASLGVPRARTALELWRCSTSVARKIREARQGTPAPVLVSLGGAP